MKKHLCGKTMHYYKIFELDYVKVKQTHRLQVSILFN